MRILAWIGTCGLLSASCGALVSFDGLSGGSTSSGATPHDGGGVDRELIDDAPDASLHDPILVRRAVATLRGIAVSSEHLYWVEGEPLSWGVYRMSKRNDTAPVAEVAHGSDVFDVAVNGENVYWSNGGAVRRASLSDASTETEHLGIGASAARYLAVDGMGRAYVTTDNAILVGPCPSFTMCKSTDPVAGSIAFGPFSAVVGASGIALAANLLFWGHDMPPGVTRGDPGTLDEAANREMDHQMPTPGPVSGVATDGTDVYWMAGDRAVLATPVSGPPDAPRIVCDDLGTADGAPGPGAVDLAVDDEWVYFTLPSARLIQKCRKKR